MKTAIVTASDSGYFAYLRDLLHSIHRHRPNADLPIFVLDAGLSPEQRSEISKLATAVLDIGWDIDFPSQPQCPLWFRALVARPMLPKHLPAFDRIIQIDADVWLQDWRCIELMLRASEDGSLAVVTEIHACYEHLYDPMNLHRMFARRCFKNAWGEETAKRMTWIPQRNSGFFALRSDSPIWSAWAQAFAEGLQNNAEPLLDQAALNVALIRSGGKTHELPSWCNWTCNLSLPMYDSEKHLLLEPCLPNGVLSAVHQISLRSQRVMLRTLQGRTCEVPLDYASFMAMGKAKGLGNDAR